MMLGAGKGVASHHTKFRENRSTFSTGEMKEGKHRYTCTLAEVDLIRTPPKTHLNRTKRSQNALSIRALKKRK
jgi:hypothetical protein